MVVRGFGVTGRKNKKSVSNSVSSLPENRLERTEIADLPLTLNQRVGGSSPPGRTKFQVPPHKLKPWGGILVPPAELASPSSR